jgi:hypothetical protein
MIDPDFVQRQKDAWQNTYTWLDKSRIVGYLCGITIGSFFATSKQEDTVVRYYFALCGGIGGALCGCLWPEFLLTAGPIWLGYNAKMRLQK